MARTQTFQNLETWLNIRHKLDSLIDYTSSYSYNTYDVTHWNGGTYFSTEDNNTGNQPDISPSQWSTISSISSSYALTASYASNGGGTTLTSGSTYNITSSYAL